MINHNHKFSVNSAS